MRPGQSGPSRKVNFKSEPADYGLPTQTATAAQALAAWPKQPGISTTTGNETSENEVPNETTSLKAESHIGFNGAGEKSAARGSRGGLCSHQRNRRMNFKSMNGRQGEKLLVGAVEE